MAKFCANCGNQMMDNAVVCPACGTPAEAQAAPAAAPAAKKVDPKIIKLGAIAVAAVAVIAIIIAIIVGAGNNYKKAINNYLDYALKCDVKKVEKLAPKMYWDYCEENKLFNIKDKDELNEAYEEVLEERKEALEDEYGKNVKYSYKITDVDELSDKKVSEYAGALKDKYDIAKKKVTKGYEVEFDITVKGKEDEDDDEMTLTVLKIDGNWYVVSAYTYDETTYVSFLDDSSNYDWEAYNKHIAENEKDEDDE